MALCEKRVDGQLMSYPCTLEAGHEQNGPVDDPEPCMTEEVPRSARIHDFWATRQEHRDGLQETAEQISEEAEQAHAGAQVADPEHNLRAANCLMRPLDSAPGVLNEICAICALSQRPQVLVDNDAAIRAGEMHNPFYSGCTKRVGGEPSLEGERCYICYPVEQPVGGPDHLFVGGGDVCEAVGCGVERWLHEQEQQVSLPVPTKQREGDQVLPKKGDRVVQDWIVDRETPKIGVVEGAEFIVEAMEESQRVGIERYGQALHTFDGRLNIRDLADELRDAFVYISKMQMTAEADKATLVRMVAEALDGVQRLWNPAEMTTDRIAEIAVDRILDWVLVQRLGPDQVMPIRVDHSYGALD